MIALKYGIIIVNLKNKLNMFNMVKPKECQVDVVHIKVTIVWCSGYRLV
jgi:hypothetical protein